jgi:aspartate-semialdehyde dehydrogenase
MIRMLRERHFPMGELRLLASARSAGRAVDVDGTGHIVAEATPEAFEGVDVALFSAGGDASRVLAPEAAKRGATVIDNSSAWRMDPAVPLVVSQVNADDLEWHEGIIANPNCSTMQLVPVLMALRDAVGLERVVVDTYQAVSGTGGKAIAELQTQVEAHVAGDPAESVVYPHPIAFNALPQVDVFLDNGYTKEEWKVVTESRKILHLPDLRISSTAVRIPRTRSTSRPSIRSARSERGRCSGPCRASSSRTIPPPRPIRSRRRPQAPTRSTSGGSARTPRSPMGAASPSGS